MTIDMHMQPAEIEERRELAKRLLIAMTRYGWNMGDPYNRMKCADRAVKMTDTLMERFAMSDEEAEQKLDKLRGEAPF